MPLPDRDTLTRWLAILHLMQLRTREVVKLLEANRNGRAIQQYRMLLRALAKDGADAYLRESAARWSGAGLPGYLKHVVGAWPELLDRLSQRPPVITSAAYYGSDLKTWRTFASRSRIGCDMVTKAIASASDGQAAENEIPMPPAERTDRATSAALVRSLLDAGSAVYEFVRTHFRTGAKAGQEWLRLLATLDEARDAAKAADPAGLHNQREWLALVKGFAAHCHADILGPGKDDEWFSRWGARYQTRSRKLRDVFLMLRPAQLAAPTVAMPHEQPPNGSLSPDSPASPRKDRGGSEKLTYGEPGAKRPGGGTEPAPAGEQPLVELPILVAASELAKELKQPAKRVETFLRRLRKKRPDCYTETDEGRRRVNEPRYLYRTAIVLPILRQQMPEWESLVTDG